MLLIFHITSIHTYVCMYIVYTTQTHAYMCVCSILSAKVQQQNELEIKIEKQIIQTQKKKNKIYIYHTTYVFIEGKFYRNINTNNKNKRHGICEITSRC